MDDSGIVALESSKDPDDGRVKIWSVRCEVPARTYGSRHAQIHKMSARELLDGELTDVADEIMHVLNAIKGLRPDGLAPSQALEIVRDLAAARDRRLRRYKREWPGFEDAVEGYVKLWFREAIRDLLVFNEEASKAEGRDVFGPEVKKARVARLADADHQSVLRYLGTWSTTKGTLNRSAKEYIGSNLRALRERKLKAAQEASASPSALALAPSERRQASGRGKPRGARHTPHAGTPRHERIPPARHRVGALLASAPRALLRSAGSRGWRPACRSRVPARGDLVVARDGREPLAN